VGCTKGDYRSSDKNLPDVLYREIYSHVFSKLPLRLINLRERKLKERSAVAEHLTSSEKLNTGAEKIKSRECEAFKCLPTMTPVQRDRLRDTVIAEWVDDVTRFAILSHTWERGELSYQDLHGQNDLSGSHLCPPDSDQDSDRKRSFEKLHNFCDIAKEYGTEFAWADNVCIDKSSSAELDESIRSMFSWYRDATICIVYLAQTNDLRDLVHDRWFARGWTLQELLAPRHLKFYSKRWHPLTEFLNDKISAEDVRKLNDQRLSRQLDLLSGAILKAAGLVMQHVRDFIPGIRHPSLPERMQWIARRVTTRGEDQSYSLMGIFDVSISIAYGEGRERAFFRLFQAILEVGYERDWLLWTGRSVSPSIHPSRMIPSSPKCYLTRNVHFRRDTPEGMMVSALENEPLSLTNVGLPMKILFVPVHVREPGKFSRYPDYTPSDAVITCPLSNKTIEIRGIHRGDDEGSMVREEFALGVLNVDPESQEDGVPCPDRLYAILLRRIVSREPQSCAYGSWKKCDTDEIITFECDDKSRISKFEVEWSVDRASTKRREGRVQTEKISFRMLFL
jgi:hypothetical protein